MKELSIKEKAEAYDKALDRARIWKEMSGMPKDKQGILDNIFPELKDVGDERIRKNLIELFHDVVWNDEIFSDYGLDKTEVLAWLEKQKDCEHIKKDWFEHLKQSWYKEGFIDGKYSGGTSKEWTINDTTTLKELIDFLENGTVKLQHDLSLYASWLKSLKPQTTWKPSDRQMKAIEHICDGNYNVDLDILDSIYRDFKKLREE